MVFAALKVRILVSLWNTIWPNRCKSLEGEFQSLLAHKKLRKCKKSERPDLNLPKLLFLAIKSIGTCFLWLFNNWWLLMDWQLWKKATFCRSAIFIKPMTKIKAFFWTILYKSIKMRLVAKSRTHYIVVVALIQCGLYKKYQLWLKTSSSYI